MGMTDLAVGGGEPIYDRCLDMTEMKERKLQRQSFDPRGGICITTCLLGRLEVHRVKITGGYVGIRGSSHPTPSKIPRQCAQQQTAKREFISVVWLFILHGGKVDGRAPHL